jgi:hypothetical protein
VRNLKNRQSLEKNQIEILEMISSISQIKKIFMENLTYQLSQMEGRMSGLEDEIDELEHSDRNKEK